MLQQPKRPQMLALLVLTGLTVVGPAHMAYSGWIWKPFGSKHIGACCQENPCGECHQCKRFGWKPGSKAFGWMHRSSNAVPDVLPLGSTVRAHDQVMETNAEAADFQLYRLHFVGQTAELTPDGKDQILEIASRMRSTPFPVIVEREPNNSNPELDALRRNLVAQILVDLGNPDAQQRTVVAPTYGPGYWSQPSQRTYYQFIGGGGQGFNNGGNFNGGSGRGF